MATVLSEDLTLTSDMVVPDWADISATQQIFLQVYDRLNKYRALNGALDHKTTVLIRDVMAYMSVVDVILSHVKEKYGNILTRYAFFEPYIQGLHASLIPMLSPLKNNDDFIYKMEQAFIDLEGMIKEFYYPVQPKGAMERTLERMIQYIYNWTHR